MAWNVPVTFVANTPLSAATLNLMIRDDLLETAPAKATAAGQIFVATGANAIAARTVSNSTTAGTNNTTTSTSYVNLSTFGPSLTVTTGTSCLLIASAWMKNDTVGEFSEFAVEISGASTISPGDEEGGITQTQGWATVTRITKPGLNPGSNTFTMKYQVSGGVGTFARRNLTVIPL